MEHRQKNQATIFGLVAVSIAVTITAITAGLLYDHTVNLLTENLRQRLLAIVTTAAVQFEADDINALQVESDYKKPEWNRIVNQLLRVEQNNSDILFAYIFRKTKDDPEKMEFVSDSHSINPYANTDDDPSNDVDVDGNGEIDSVDYLQWPGQPYDEAPEDAFLAYNGPLTNRDLYEDSYGRVITGYAPIKDKNGKIAAILAIDIRAGDFFRITTQTLIPFISFIVFLIGLLLILTWALIRIWNKRVELVEEIDRQKDELLSIVTHQLAAPVTAMKWYLELLQDEEIGKLTNEQQQQIKTMQSVTLNLSDLVGMILDVSRVQLGRMRVEKQVVDVDDFVKDIMRVIEPKAEEKSIKLITKINVEIEKPQFDKRLTRMTLENLLTNAVKYTPKGGTVHFSISSAGSRLIMEVSDTGCGIPKADQQKIFGKLFRASNVRDKIEGNGFGLYVAKGAIEAQGGKIAFTSEEGKGTTFTFEMPV